MLIPASLRAFAGHLNGVSARLRTDDHAALRLPPDTRFVFLCFTNRCGSNFIASALASDGRLNLGREILNHEFVARETDGRDIPSFQLYFATMVRDLARSGHFVTKTAADHLFMLAASGILAEMLARSTFLRISRNDRLAQAISHSIAAQTGQWASYLPASGISPHYSRTEIDALMQSVDRQYAAMDAFFALNGIVPIDITYEHFVAAPEASLAHLGAALGIDRLRYVPGNIRPNKQAGALNAQWRRRHLAETQNGLPPCR